MTATWTNAETGKKMTVFVHGAEDRNGKSFLVVNKGAVKSMATFRVSVADTNVVMA